MILKEALPKIITGSLPGSNAEKMIQRRAVATPGAIKCVYPCVIKRAAGAMIEDVDGNIFLDWVGGVGVLNVGHAHPEIIAAVKAQADNYFHSMFNIVTHEGYVSLAEKMNEIVPVAGRVKKTFFANSGAEANENAVKIAKAFTKRPNIIVFSGAFHGRTTLTMAMTAKKAYAKGMGPFPDGIYRAEYPYLYRKPGNMTDSQAISYYIEKLERVFDEASPAESVAAIILEPLQGEGGFIPAPFEWVKRLREICNENGILLIADEIQTGFGRTGRLFASNYWQEGGFAPDIITTAKSIAAGIPVSAITARAEIMDSVPGGVIGGTFGGNALACAAALKVIEIIEKDKLCERSMEIGAKCRAVFAGWQEKYEVVGDVRGLGSMLGIEFIKDKSTRTPAPALVSALVAECARQGLLIENAGSYGNVIRCLWPLVITDEQLDTGLTIFRQAIEKCTAPGT